MNIYSLRLQRYYAPHFIVRQTSLNVVIYFCSEYTQYFQIAEMNNICFALTHTCILIESFLYILYLQTWLSGKTVPVCGPKASITCPIFPGYSHISNYILESYLTKLTYKSHKSMICLLMLHLKSLACGIHSSK